MKKLKSFIKGLIYILPAVLYLSYYPIISFGATGTMNFELSLPLIWLVVFDITSVVAVFKFKKTKVIAGKWWYYLFPFFATLSVFWSSNPLRGALTLGVMWAVIIAIMGFVILKKEIFDTGFKKNFLKWFFGATLVVCAWCLLQCLLDVFGVSRDYTLMCLGCTYRAFGFPHPNGFAIEPQFMGNLLLAPAIVSAYFAVVDLVDSRHPLQRRMLFYFLVITATLFLTFSRGAIYAFVVAMIFLTVMQIVKTKKWRVMLVWPLILVAFLFTLNLQGVMAQISPTEEGYYDGIRRAVSQLTLGKINLPGDERKQENASLNTEETSALSTNLSGSNLNDEASFDGYVPESTDVRVKLTNVALEEWQKSKKNMLVGVGIGGAGQALYNDGLIDSPKEIVQNQYASLLLETGLIGITMLVILALGFLKWCKGRKYAGMVLTLAVAYAVSLCFFSGLPNALHIYLLLALFCYDWSYEKSA